MENLPPFRTGTDDSSRMEMLGPVVALDGTAVYQQLLTVGFEIDGDDGSFSFQIKPDSLTSRPRYLIVARLADPRRLGQETDHRQ